MLIDLTCVNCKRHSSNDCPGVPAADSEKLIVSEKIRTFE